IGYLLAGLSSGLAALAAALFIGGLGASTQHPLAAMLISRAFGPGRTMKAIGAYNFAGDIGKMTVPAAASLLLVVLPWRQAVMILGSVGVIAAILIYVVIPRLPAIAP